MRFFKHAITLLLLCLCALAASALAGEITYYHNDLSGSPVVATNQAGQVVWRESYRPYGERLKNEPAGQENQTWFTSRHQDADTGLVYMGARYYDPMLGRFLSVDSMRFDEKNIHSFNRYAYGNNNPYRFVDPDGNAALPVLLIALDVSLMALDANNAYREGGFSAAAWSVGTNVAINAVTLGTGVIAKHAFKYLNGANKGGDLFRVVDDVELADIQKTGAFGTVPGQFEGKQFVDNLEDAQKLQKKFSDFFGGNQTIVKGGAPQSVLDNASRTPFSDIPNGTAITVPKSDLPAIKPKL